MVSKSGEARRRLQRAGMAVVVLGVMAMGVGMVPQLGNAGESAQALAALRQREGAAIVHVTWLMPTVCF